MLLQYHSIFLQNHKLNSLSACFNCCTSPQSHTLIKGHSIPPRFSHWPGGGTIWAVFGPRVSCRPGNQRTSCRQEVEEGVGFGQGPRRHRRQRSHLTVLILNQTAPSLLTGLAYYDWESHWASNPLKSGELKGC